MIKLFYKLSRSLSVTGFAALCAGFGMGATWIVLCILAASVCKNDPYEILGNSLPILLSGGFIGLVVGLIVSLRVARSSAATRRKIEGKSIYLNDRYRIYLGAPLCVIVLLGIPFFEKLLNLFGNQTGAYIGLGIALAIIAASLFLYDRIPRRFIIPIGIAGWLLVFLMAIGWSIYEAGGLDHFISHR